MAQDNEEQAGTVTYEELANIEHEFEDIELEIVRKQYLLTKSLYEKRQSVTSKITGFWPLVLEEAPPEIDRFIQLSDSEIFATCLQSIQVSRFELDADGEHGDPRSLSITFTFSENAWFDAGILEKRFWWRRAADGWTGLVSEPVRVPWKKGKDPTKGLMDGAIKLWEARKQGGDMRRRDMPEFDHMAKITETWNGDNTSFFTWFAFVSSRRWVSAEESAAAVVAEKDRRRRASQGLETTAAVQLPDDDQLERQVEAHEDGDTLATIIAEDLWPGAIKYFTQAQESAELSDEGFEEDEDDEDEDEDGSDSNGSVGGRVDLRKLAQGTSSTAKRDAAGSDGDEPSRKKRKA